LRLDISEIEPGLYSTLGLVLRTGINIFKIAVEKKVLLR
jgi:hypothetical protein